MIRAKVSCASSERHALCGSLLRSARACRAAWVPRDLWAKILNPPPVGTDLTTINFAPPGHWGHLLPFAGILGGAPDGESSEPATAESKLELFRVPFRF